MKKTALHFKIASWSCRQPAAFYAIGFLVLALCIGLGALVGNIAVKGAGVSNPPMTADAWSKVSAGEDWKPIRDMDLPDGVKCRLYRNSNTSITNCYKFSKGEWSFYQSF